MITTTKEIGLCSNCPFIGEDNNGGWTCDAGHDFETGVSWDGYPRSLPAIHGQAPPDWCRLRQGPIIVQLTAKAAGR